MPTYTEAQWAMAALDAIAADPDINGSTAVGQGAALWVELMKKVINSGHLKNAIDWNVDRVDSLVNASAESDADGGVVYGIFGWCTDTSEPTLIVVRDTTTSFTLNSGAMNAAETAANEFITVNIPAASATTNVAYGSAVFPDGVPCTVGITYAADGVGGNAPAANACKMYIVYRSTVEVRGE